MGCMLILRSVVHWGKRGECSADGELEIWTTHQVNWNGGERVV